MEEYFNSEITIKIITLKQFKTPTINYVNFNSEILINEIKTATITSNYVKNFSRSIISLNKNIDSCSDIFLGLFLEHTKKNICTVELTATNFTEVLLKFFTPDYSSHSKRGESENLSILNIENNFTKNSELKRIENQINNPFITSLNLDEILLNEIGLILERESLFKLAEFFFKKSIDFNWKFYPPYFNYRIVMVWRDLALKCNEYFSGLLEKNPENDNALNCIGSLRPDELASDTLKIYEKAFQLNPKNYAAINNIGIVHYGKSNFEEAEKYYKLSLEVKPDYFVALRNLGELYLILGKIQSGVRHLKKSYIINQRYYGSLWVLERVFGFLEKTDESSKYLRKRKVIDERYQ